MYVQHTEHRRYQTLAMTGLLLAVVKVAHELADLLQIWATFTFNSIKNGHKPYNIL